MKAIRLRHPFGLEYLEHVDIADPGAPGVGEIRVRPASAFTHAPRR